jgi:hypothetical protein
VRLLREQAAAQRQAKTKAARRSVRRAQQASPEYRVLKRGRVLNRAVLQAERRYTLGWSRVRVAVDEHDLPSVVLAARALARANAALSRAQRALRLHQEQVPAQQAAAHRAIILPEQEEQ